MEYLKSISNETFWAAVGVIIGTIFGGIGTFIVTCLTIKSNEKINYTSFITKERLKWLETIREEFTELYSLIEGTYELRDYSLNLSGLDGKDKKKISKIIQKLILLLNPKIEDEKNKNEKSIINNLKELRGKIFSFDDRQDKSDTSSEIKKILDETRDLIAKLLKENWEISKKEVKDQDFKLKIHDFLKK